MEAVIGGWVAGYVMAMVSTVALTAIVIRMRDVAAIERVIARDVPGMMLAVPISIGTTVIWTFVGVSLGILFEVANLADSGGGFGSPSLSFTSVIVIVAAAAAILPAMLWTSRWWLWVTLGVAFALSFGWLMPWLATR